MTAHHGRFAPSPTGPLHLGNLRTALLAWLMARNAGARFVVRMEDLDRDRVRPGAERSQLSDLAALGLDWDGPVLRQSERREHYDAALERLARDGRLYECFCTRAEIRAAASAPQGEAAVSPGYPGTCRDLTRGARRAREQERRPALRLRASRACRGFTDARHGACSGPVDDVVVRRNDGTPAYHLAVVVDDGAQGVDEVVRGEDLLAATPPQLELAEALAIPVVAHVHVPLVLGPDGRRLAKRHGSVSLGALIAAGHGPDAVRGHLATSMGLAEPGESPSVAVLVGRVGAGRLALAPWRVPARLVGG